MPGGSHGGLADFFDGEKVVCAVLHDENSGCFGLSMEGIEADYTPIKIEFVKEGSGDGDFVCLLGRHDRTAQIKLGGRGNGGDNRVTASVSGFFTVDVDEFARIGCASDLTLDLKECFFEFLGFDSGHQTAKRRLLGRGVFAVAAADAQGSTLSIAQSGRKLFEILLPARGAAEVRQKDNGQQAPEWVDADACTVVGHRFEVPDDGTDFLRALRGARVGLGFHHCQRGLERSGGETPACAANKFFGKKPFGLAMRGVVAPFHAFESVGFSQLTPPAGTVNCAAVLLGIDKSFHQKDGMSIALLPVG